MKLYEHQKKALDQTKDLNRVAYFLDMGLGKTFVGSEKMAQLGATMNLVICQKSKVDDWINHFKTYYPKNYGWFRNLTNSWSIEEFVKYQTPFDPQIGVINYELAWRRPELLQMKESFTLMLDESSLIQNATAKRTKFILKMKPDNVILLSGTPCSGKYENLWTQAHLLGWDISKKAYDSTYVNWRRLDLGTRSVQIVDKSDPYKNVERLKSKLREHGAVFLKTEECFDLPSQTIIDVRCGCTKAYTTFMKDSIITMEDATLVGDTTLTKRLYARMIASQYNDYKQEAFEELLQSTNDRLIVFYNFNSELEILKTLCDQNQKSMSFVNGSVKDLTAYEEDDASVTLVQYQAGAKGLNLQKANKLIYFSPTEKCEDYMQSMKRIHRIGQDQPCFYYRMIASGTIEEDIYKALERGEDYTEELFRDATK